MRRVKFILGILCFGLLGPAWAGDFTQIGPQVPAATLLAARPATHEPALEFVYKVEGDDTGLVTVDLATDFIAVRRGDVTTIYDYALRRIVVVDSKAHTFANGSLFAYVGVHVADTNRRRGMRNRGDTGDDGVVLDPFWVQSELHVMKAEDGMPSIDRSEDTDGVHFRYDGKTVSSYAFSQQTLTQAQAAMFGKFLATSTLLHPTIIKEIAAGGRLPQRLAFKRPPGKDGSDIVWTLQSSASTDAAYPLPKKFKRLWLPAGESLGELSDVLPLMEAAVAGTASGRRLPADYRAAIERSLAEGRPFEAMLTGFLFNEHYGTAATECADTNGCHSLKDIFGAARGDPRFADLVTALTPPKGQYAGAIAALRRISRDGLENGYVLDDFLANDLVESGQLDGAFPLFAAALKADPYLGGYFKDTGDYFRERFQPGAAWICYDLARALPTGPNAPVVGSMNDYENYLSTTYPEFF